MASVGERAAAGRLLLRPSAGLCPSVRLWRGPFSLRRVLCLAACALTIWWAVAWLAARALVVRAELPHADALVVLSGSADYVERAQWGAQLFRAGRAPQIILTNDGLQGGWSNTEQRNPFFFERTRAELQRAGVPVEQIAVLPQPVASTYEEAQALRRYAAARQLRSLLVVTSPYHARRALWTLRQVFHDSGVTIGLESPPEAAPVLTAATWWLSDTGWRRVGGEYVKQSYYWLAYR